MTTLQAAAARGVDPTTIHAWVKRGKLKPIARSGEGKTSLCLFDPDEVMMVEARPPGRPITRLASQPAPVPAAPIQALPPGIRLLAKMGRFRRANPTHAESRPMGGGVLLGRVKIGTDWLRVYRHDSGLVYHELAEWMDSDPDWMEAREHAETAVLLGYTKEAA